MTNERNDEGISQPSHSLAPSLSAESQGSWQEVFQAVVFRSMKSKKLRVSDLHQEIRRWRIPVLPNSLKIDFPLLLLLLFLLLLNPHYTRLQVYLCANLSTTILSYLEGFLKTFSYERGKLRFYRIYFVMRRSIMSTCLCPNIPNLGKEKENEISRIDRESFPSILPIDLSPQCAPDTENATLRARLCIESSMR